MNEQEQHDERHHDHHHHEHHIDIKIDHDSFHIHQLELTGEQIRQLPKPPIGPERDLYEEIHGPDDDRLIGNDELVHLRNGMHFFTAPHTINPG